MSQGYQVNLQVRGGFRRDLGAASHRFGPPVGTPVTEKDKEAVPVTNPSLPGAAVMALLKTTPALANLDGILRELGLSG